MPRPVKPSITADDTVFIDSAFPKKKIDVVKIESTVCL